MINIALVSIYFVVIFRYRFTRFLFGIANFYTFILIPLLHLPSHSFSFHHFPIVQMSVHSFVSSSSTAYEPKVLMSQAIKVASLFELSDGYLQKAVDSYISQANESLAVDSERGIPMIPSYVSCTPSGKEKGVLIAFDLGGTNFRVCSVKLGGNSTYEIVQDKTQVPVEIMSSTLESFITYLADHIETFLQKTHPDHLAKAKAGSKEMLRVGFTFSFPLAQSSANSGTLIRWTKGYDIEEAVGQDLPQILQKELDARHLNLFIAAVVNDTVGTLLTRSYTKPSNYGPTIVGCIFGTGTNGAYNEPLSNIKKFSQSAHPEVVDKEMVINTEWGSFDNDLKILPNTKYDKQLNENTPNKDFHMFEKRVSGMFLGELLRLVMVDLHAQGYLFVSDEAKNLLSNKGNALFTPWSMNTATPAAFHGDTSKDLRECGAELESKLGFKATFEELQAIQVIAKAIGVRSGHLSAVPIAGALLHSKALDKYETVDVGADGSVYERYPGFHQLIMDGLARTDVGPEGVKRITMGIAKDGSGVGAALCALEVKV